MLASAQESNAYKPTTVADAVSEVPQKGERIYVVPLPGPRDLFGGSTPSREGVLWKIHLALQLVKQPELDQCQLGVVLDAISLQSPEFFTRSNHGPAQGTKANHALKSLNARALRAFVHDQAAELFANIAGGKTDADILKMYYGKSALPLKNKNKSFRNTSLNDKSDLWRTHLALFLVKRSELSARQTEIILAAMSLATPEHFEVQSSDPSWKAKGARLLRALEEQIVSAVSLKDAAKIFADWRRCRVGKK